MKFAPTFVAWVVTSALMVCGASAQAPRRTTPKSSAGVNILLITLASRHVGRASLLSGPAYCACPGRNALESANSPSAR